MSGHAASDTRSLVVPSFIHVSRIPGVVAGGPSAPVTIHIANPPVQPVLILGESPRRMGPNDHDDIVAVGPVVLHHAKRLAQQTLDPSPDDRPPNATSDAQSETTVLQAVGSTADDERALDLAAASGEHGLEVSRMAKPMATSKRAHLRCRLRPR